MSVRPRPVRQGVEAQVLVGYDLPAMAVRALVPNDDILQASAVRFLIDGNEQTAANALLYCELKLAGARGDVLQKVPYGTIAKWLALEGDSGPLYVKVTVTGPRSAYDILNEPTPVADAVYRAIRAVLPREVAIDQFTVQAELVNIEPGWRTELLEAACGRGILNQATLADTPIRTWNNLKFRSQSEVRIAEALERAGALFFPNCAARLSLGTARGNREPDFLVCQDGKWGILQVDGEPFHPPQRTVHEHEQDRHFHNHGIAVVQHFDATRCYEHADQVVQQFLGLLKRL
jgi:hypothetical protein